MTKENLLSIVIGLMMGIVLTMAATYVYPRCSEVVPVADSIVAETLYVPNPNSLKLSKQHNLPYHIADAIYEAASRNKISIPLAVRLAKTESNLNPKATSPTGAIGLYQVLHSTARHYDPHITRQALYDPKLNSSIGLRFLRDMRRRYDGDMWRALIAYNEGPAVADTYNVDTHKYADHVLRRKSNVAQ